MTVRLTCAPDGLPPTEIRIGRGCLGDALAELATDGRRTLAVIDARLAAAAATAPRLPASWTVLPIDAGEGAKTFAVLEDLLRNCARAGLDRRGRLVVVGGGSLGDVVGLAASLWLRGVEHVQAPTTLLAMVDSAVGGKTALNLVEGKNLVGTVWPARLVVADVDFLASLPDTEFRSGLAEAVKAGIGFCAATFAWLRDESSAILRRDPDALVELLRLAIAAKVRIVEMDPREHGPRRLLNLGHTLGHALEAWSGYAIPHGLAVARGLHFAVSLAVERGLLAAGDAEAMRAVLTTYGFAPTPLPPLDALAPYLRVDKKVDGDRLHFVVPTAIGASDAVPLSVDVIIDHLRRA